MDHSIKDIRQAVDELKHQLVYCKRLGKSASDSSARVRQQLQKTKQRQATIDEQICQTRSTYVSWQARLDGLAARLHLIKSELTKTTLN